MPRPVLPSLLTAVPILAACWGLCLADETPQTRYPLSIAVNADKDIFLADRNLPGIWKISHGKLTLFAEGSKKFRMPLNAIRCVAIDKDGNVLAGDSSTRDIYRIAESGESQPLTNGGIGIPMSIAVDSQGNLFVSDLELHIIWKVPPTGGEPKEFARVPAPRGLAMDSKDQLWVISFGEDQLLRIDKQGKVEPVVRGRKFSFPHTVALDDESTAYVADGYAKTIWKVAAGEAPEAWIQGEPLDNPVGLAWRDKTLLIVDPRANQVFQVDSEGKLLPLEY